MSPKQKLSLEQMRDRAARKLADLEARLRQGQGVPIDDDSQLVPSATGAAYDRTTRPLRWKIECILCERKGVIATRYPGPAPSICDECYAKFADDPEGRQDARNEAKKAERERAKEGKPKRRKAERIAEGEE